MTGTINNDGSDPIAARLAAAGVQPTAQRVEIARVLLERPRHLSADRLSAILMEQGARVSKATVYNTLKLLCARGLLKAVNVDPNRIFYDSTTRPHHHFYNVDSGELTDIPAEQVRFADLPALPRGTAQEGVDVIVRVRNTAPAR
ncbi:MAG TPA: Fur family transcriptional regulator [Gammaproteobacteria bacterium]|nr:Fur family transcriptional regulator [Gammaproteobacteria bacterium]